MGKLEGSLELNNERKRLIYTRRGREAGLC
jgi:hypothetical protein